MIRFAGGFGPLQCAVARADSLVVRIRPARRARPRGGSGRGAQLSRDARLNPLGAALVRPRAPPLVSLYR